MRAAEAITGEDVSSGVSMMARYRDDTEKWGGSPEMLRLVEYLSAQEYACLFYPATSLMRLCISTQPIDQNPVSSLVIWFDDVLKLYQLVYYVGSLRKPEKRVCSESEIRNVIELKLLRLSLTAG